MLKDISYDVLFGGCVELYMNFVLGQVFQLSIFIIGMLLCIVVDFVDIDNVVFCYFDIGKGFIFGVLVVLVGGCMCVVVELMCELIYIFCVDGNSVVLMVNNGSVLQIMIIVVIMDLLKCLLLVSNGLVVFNIDFCCGFKGEGCVLINFSGVGVSFNMCIEGDKVIVEFEYVNFLFSQVQ